MNNHTISNLLKYIKAETKENFSHQEIANLLEIDENILKKVIENTTPVTGMPNMEYYRKEDIAEWVEMLLEKHPDTITSILVNKSKLKTCPVYTYLRPANIIMNLKVAAASNAIEEIINAGEKTNLINNRNKFLQLVLTREASHTTAMGGGVAFPHPRSASFEIVKTTLIMLGISKKGVEFNAVDGQLVHIVVLLAVPILRMHLQLLSRLVTIFNSDTFKNEIINSSTEKEVIEKIEEREMGLF